jgi:GDSL-like Lipase/Acylhydrolase family
MTTPACAAGGAPAQIARTLAVDLVDLTRDANTTHGVLADLARAPAAAEIVTLTAGGNDLLGGDLPHAILRRLRQIAEKIQPLGARVVINTIYDPCDGDNEVGRCELGLSRPATIELRRRLNAVKPRHREAGPRARLPARRPRAALPRTRPRIKRPLVRPGDRAEPSRRNRDRQPLVRTPDVVATTTRPGNRGTDTRSDAFIW